MTIPHILGRINGARTRKSVIGFREANPTTPEAATMPPLSPRTQQVLDWIKDQIAETGLPPTRAELAQGVGFKDASSVNGHLEMLAKGGWIQLFPNKKRGIRVLDPADLPLLGPLAEVAAGTPILAEGNIVERIPSAVGDRFRPRPDYFLTVRGDSMDRTGLRDGDIVAIRQKGGTADSGDVVVARFGDEVTLKRFVRVDERHVELRPESHNPDHVPMKIDLAKHILDIDGVAVGALIAALHPPAEG